MKALGIRVGPQKTRVAIVERVDSNICLLNAETESRLVYPSDASAIEDRLYWLYQEMERLHNAYPDIARVFIKSNEFTQTETKAKRETAYLEAVIVLYWREQSVNVELNTYATLATRRDKVKSHAEHRVGKTAKYWDIQMADAVVAAWKALRS